MKNNFKFTRIYLKDNVKNFYNIYIMYIVILSTIFYFIAGLLRLIGFSFVLSNSYIYLSVAIIFSVIGVINLTFTYLVYNKKNHFQLTTYRILGISLNNIFFAMLCEFIMIIAVSIALGLLIDFIFLKKYPYISDMNWAIFGYTSLTVTLVGIVGFFIGIIKEIVIRKHSYGAI